VTAFLPAGKPVATSAAANFANCLTHRVRLPDPSDRNAGADGLVPGPKVEFAARHPVLQYCFLIGQGLPEARLATDPPAGRLQRHPKREHPPMSFSLPDLPYSYDALAPYMSRETLEYHHDKHHLAYVNNGNNLLKGTEWEGKSLEEIVKGSFGKNAGLFNNAGQHYNHIHFWKWMKPGGGGDKIPGALEKKIVSDLGSVAKMKEDFAQAGVTQFGSGWCWLAVKDGKIAIMKTANGESPLVHGASPILGCDVWEHSYYIDYRNRRPDYLKAFVDHLVNWDYVAEMYEKAAK
jgi:Fe-Mn family superoxide dismutase